MTINDAQLFAQTRTLRIRQVYGIDFSTGISTSPLRAVAILTPDHFHKVSRAVGPQKTGMAMLPDFLSAASMAANLRST